MTVSSTTANRLSRWFIIGTAFLAIVVGGLLVTAPSAEARSKEKCEAYGSN